MRIHHLNCGSLCPRGGRMLGGAGGPLSPAPMCCHCLLIECDDRLILVDTGLGVEDVNDSRRLGFLFNAMTRPQLAVAETALRQVADLGFRPDDVRQASCRPISTSTMPEAWATFPARRSMFSQPSFAPR